jgi:hypothetical protein
MRACAPWQTERRNDLIATRIDPWYRLRTRHIHHDGPSADGVPHAPHASHVPPPGPRPAGTTLTTRSEMDNTIRIHLDDKIRNPPEATGLDGSGRLDRPSARVSTDPNKSSCPHHSLEMRLVERENLSGIDSSAGHSSRKPKVQAGLVVPSEDTSCTRHPF